AAGTAMASGAAGNVSVTVGKLNEGAPLSGPYDAIVLEGATEIVPNSLLSQLKDGGRLVGVVGFGPLGKATLYRMTDGHATAQPLFDAAAPPLPGFVKPPAFVF